MRLPSCRAAELTDLFDKFQPLIDQREALDAVLTTHTTAEWMERLGGVVPSAPALGVGEALDNPFVAERQGVADFGRAEGGAPPRMLTSPIRVDGHAPPNDAAPRLGADTEAVLGRIGVDAAGIAQLRKEGTIR